MRQQDQDRKDAHARIWYASVLLCCACVLFFVAQHVWGTDQLVLDAALVGSEPWRALTALFCHSSVAHLLSNLFALGLFGTILEGRIGSRRTLLLFLISGLSINAIIALFTLYPRSLGASGAIYALLGALVVLRPRMTVWLDMIPLPMALAGVVWAAQDILGVFMPSDVANLAHLFGLAIGIGTGFAWRPRFSDPTKRKRSKRGDEEDIDRRLDAWEEEHMR